MGRLFSIILILLSFEQAFAECSMTNNCGFNVAVSVDLNSKCMCVKGNCFLIDIGKNGPSMTTGGAGQLKKAEGAKYQTKPGPGSTGYDNDAILPEFLEMMPLENGSIKLGAAPRVGNKPQKVVSPYLAISGQK